MSHIGIAQQGKRRSGGIHHGDGAGGSGAGGSGADGAKNDNQAKRGKRETKETKAKSTPSRPGVYGRMTRQFRPSLREELARAEAELATTQAAGASAQWPVAMWARVAELETEKEDHDKALAELTEDFEGRLQEEVSILERERGEKEGLIAEFDETRRQLEEDVDREIEELKEKYEAKLATEREAALRLKGENGIMRKKFTALQKDIEDQKEAMRYGDMMGEVAPSRPARRRAQRSLLQPGPGLTSRAALAQ